MSEGFTAPGSSDGPRRTLRSDCGPVGRDPRKMTPDDLRALGQIPMTPAAAIRARTVSIAVAVAQVHGGEMPEREITEAMNQ